jgi:hypothetical protein
MVLVPGEAVFASCSRLCFFQSLSRCSLSDAGAEVVEAEAVAVEVVHSRHRRLLAQLRSTVRPLTTRSGNRGM